MSGEFVGLGTSLLYGRLAMQVAEACASAVWPTLSACRSRPGRGTVPTDASPVLHLALVARGYTPGTAVKYASCVSAFLHATGRRSVDELRSDDVVDYLQREKLAGKANGTLRVQLCALRAVFDRLLGMQITAGIAHVPRPAPIPPAEAEQVRAIMVAARRSPRDRLVVDMLNRSKLRQGVLRLLKTPEGDPPLFIGLDRGISMGNGAVPGIVPLEIAEDGTGSARWLLPSTRLGAPISTRTIRRIVQRHAVCCGFAVTCTAIRKAAVVPMRTVA